VTGPRRLCQHCNVCIASRPRGLCWACYHAPGVRDLYPVTSKFHRACVYSDGRLPPAPPAPTGALPGTPEKLAVLEERAAGGYRLWHPLDYVPDAEGA
jgi:hypothetical protein